MLKQISSIRSPGGNSEGMDKSNTCCVPVIEISKESADDTWSAVVGAIRGATYVALDLVSYATGLFCDFLRMY